MTNISVDSAIKLFGVIEGIRFWFKWRIIVPTELFYYKNVSHKKWCYMYGYKCKSRDCEYPHYSKPLMHQHTHINIE